MRTYTPILLCALALPSCGSQGPAVPTPPPTVAVESSATSAPTPTPSAEAGIGVPQESSSDDTDLKITVYGMRQPLPVAVPGVPERRGYEYAAVEVRACLLKNDGEPMSLSWHPWSLSYADDTIVEELTGWSQEWWNVPLYPNDTGRTAKVGRCVRGWIPFEVRKGSRAMYVNYDPDGSNPLQWKVK